MEDKKLEILVVEDTFIMNEDGTKVSKNEFQNFLNEGLIKKGYQGNITLISSYDEFKNLDIKDYDAILTDINIEDNSYSVEREILKNWPSRKEEITNSFSRYAEAGFSQIFKDDAIDSWVQTWIDILKRPSRTKPCGFLIVQDCNEQGKEVSAYSSYTSHCGHALEGTILNALIEAVPFEDFCSVASQELKLYKEKNKEVKLILPESGKATIMSSKGTYEKTLLYPDAIEAAIKYQTK